VTVVERYNCTVGDIKYDTQSGSRGGEHHQWLQPAACKLTSRQKHPAGCQWRPPQCVALLNSG
jgi:hypothetical protein